MNVQKWLRARMVLGWALLVHLLAYPRFRRRANPKLWLARIAREALGATPKENWADAPSASRCIQCGLCSLLENPSAARFDHLVAGHSRLSGDAQLTGEDLGALEAHAKELAALCPVGVDAAAIARMVRRNRLSLTAAGA